VPIDKQTPKLTEQMIRQCQVLPIQLGPQIDQQRDKAMVQSGNPFFKQHGLRVDPNQMRTEAQVLFPPAIQYNPPNDRVEPDRTGSESNLVMTHRKNIPVTYASFYSELEWRTVGREVPQRRAYTACATWPTRWAVVIVQNSLPQNPCQSVIEEPENSKCFNCKNLVSRQFCRELVNTAQKRGIGDADMPQRVDHFEDNTLCVKDNSTLFTPQILSGNLCATSSSSTATTSAPLCSALRPANATPNPGTFTRC